MRIIKKIHLKYTKKAKSKVLFLLFIFVLVFFVVIVISNNFNKRNREPISSNQKLNNYLDLSANKNAFPVGMTENWILETGAQVIYKSNELTSSGQQGTLIYESKLSQKVAAQNYEKFLKENGWETNLTENAKFGLIIITGTKGSDSVNLNIDINDISKKVTVNVVYTQSLVSVEK